jgi:hypothetical protein
MVGGAVGFKNTSKKSKKPVKKGCIATVLKVKSSEDSYTKSALP